MVTDVTITTRTEMCGRYGLVRITSISTIELSYQKQMYLNAKFGIGPY